MAIKAYKLLATSDVADGPFRSLQDVERYMQSVEQKIKDLDGLIRQLQTQFARAAVTSASELEFDVGGDNPKGKKGTKITLDKIDKVVVPKLESLKKNFSVVDELSEQIDQLEALYNSVQINFRGVRGADVTLQSIQDMKSTAEAKMNKALQFLGGIGQKHAPKPFTELVEQAIGFISPSLTFKSHETSLYAFQTEEKDLAFAVYIKLNNLKNDTGEVHKQLFVVFTCVLKASSTEGKVEPAYFVTLLNNFVVPGKYDEGKQIQHAADATSALSLLFDMENVGITLGQLPHGLNSKKIQKVKFSAGNRVETIKVDPNTVTFTFVKSVDQEEAETLSVDLYKDMKGLLAHIKKATITTRVFQTNKIWNVKYTLTNVAKQDQINVNDLEFLKEHFDLDEKQLEKVVRVING